ncbi:MAG: CTAG/PCC1 family protein [Candidatus Diapherotrites archaeon]
MHNDYSLEIALDFPSQQSAEITANAIRPEMRRGFEKRSESLMNINKNILSLKVNAKDKIALKASFNAFMKLVILVDELIESGGIGNGR